MHLEALLRNFIAADSIECPMYVNNLQILRSSIASKIGIVDLQIWLSKTVSTLFQMLK